MERAQKAEVVAERQKVLESAESIVVVRNAGLRVDQSTELRNRMRAAGVNFKVSKNRLVKIALKGTRYEGIEPMLTGPVALATSTDPVAAAKIAFEFAKDNEKLIIVGGALGEKVLDKAGVEALSKLPSLDEMRASLLRLIQTPATRIATIAKEPASQLARVIQAYADKG
ncbi:MAG: 50S ribosomal protein L10 [Alphaproteobacteria bacterium]|nr:50S ribosomal protein L10 [Alphaproteobacteria bacterium]